MSETVVFVIGVVIWAITVAGVVISGGYLLGNPRRAEERARDRKANEQGD